MRVQGRHVAVFLSGCVSILLFGQATGSAEPLTLVGEWKVPLPQAPDRRTQVVGNREYRAAGATGLQIFDISNPAQPSILGTYRDPAGRALAVVVTNDLAFVAYGERELQIINVANPANAFRVNGFYATNRPAGGSYGYGPPVIASDVALAGDLVYLADGLSGLQIVNVSQPGNPALVGIYQTAQAAVRVAVNETNVTVLADVTAYILDVSNPATPRLVTTTPTLARINCVAVSGSILLAGLDHRSVEVIDVSDPVAPLNVGRVPIDTWANDIAVSGQTALLANAAAGVRVIDISDANNPRMAGTFATTAPAWGVAVAGTRGYAAAGSDLYIIDLSNPAQPRQLGRYRSTNNNYRVSVAGDLAFLDKFYEGPMEIVNVADPSNPASIGAIPVHSSAAFVRGGIAYVASDEGVKVFDIDNPSAPRLLGTNADPGPSIRDIAVQGSYVFQANSAGPLTILQLTDQYSLIPVASYASASGLRGIAANEQFVFAGDYSSGLKIFRNENAGLRLRASRAGAAPAFEVLNATPGARYVLDRAASLSTPVSWSPLATNTIQNYTGSFSTTASGEGREFFRLRQAQ